MSWVGKHVLMRAQAWFLGPPVEGLLKQWTCIRGGTASVEIRTLQGFRTWVIKPYKHPCQWYGRGLLTRGPSACRSCMRTGCASRVAPSGPRTWPPRSWTPGNAPPSWHGAETSRSASLHRHLPFVGMAARACIMALGLHALWHGNNSLPASYQLDASALVVRPLEQLGLNGQLWLPILRARG